MFVLGGAYKDAQKISKVFGDLWSIDLSSSSIILTLNLRKRREEREEKKEKRRKRREEREEKKEKRRKRSKKKIR